MRRWKHQKITDLNYDHKVVGHARHVPESDYRKIMAVYKAAVKWNCAEPDIEREAVRVLQEAVEKAEK